MCDAFIFLRCTKNITAPDVQCLYFSQMYQESYNPICAMIVPFSVVPRCTNPISLMTVPFSDVPRVLQPQMCHDCMFWRCTNNLKTQMCHESSFLGYTQNATIPDVPYLYQECNNPRFVMILLFLEQPIACTLVLITIIKY